MSWLLLTSTLTLSKCKLVCVNAWKHSAIDSVADKQLHCAGHVCLCLGLRTMCTLGNASFLWLLLTQHHKVT